MEYIKVSLVIMSLSLFGCMNSVPDIEELNKEDNLILSVQPHLNPDSENSSIRSLRIIIRNKTEHDWIIERPVLDHNLSIFVFNSEGIDIRQNLRSVNPSISEDFFILIQKDSSYEADISLSTDDYHFNDTEYTVKAVYSAPYIELYERNYGPLKHNQKIFQGQISSARKTLQPFP